MLTGLGLGLRTPHLAEIIEQKPKIPWFEVLADNFIDCRAALLTQIEQLSRIYPVALHSVGMSLGSTDPLDFEYLGKIRELVHKLKPKFLSDHLSWTSIHGVSLHNLMPLPYTEEAVEHVVARIKQAQDFFDCQIAIENISAYIDFKMASMSEVEFVVKIAEKADCLLLVDISNLYLNSTNNRLSCEEYLEHIPPKRVAYMHLGGFDERDGFLVDDHAHAIDSKVIELAQHAMGRFGAVPLLLEWDNDLPKLDVFLAEHQLLEASFDKCAKVMRG